MKIVAQWVQHLLGTCQALASILSPVFKVVNLSKSSEAGVGQWIQK